MGLRISFYRNVLLRTNFGSQPVWYNPSSKPVWYNPSSKPVWYNPSYKPSFQKKKETDPSPQYLVSKKKDRSLSTIPSFQKKKTDPPPKNFFSKKKKKKKKKK